MRYTTSKSHTALSVFTYGLSELFSLKTIPKYKILIKITFDEQSPVNNDKKHTLITL